MHEKKNVAKIATSDSWLSRQIIAKLKNQTLTLNVIEYQNKINDALKLHKKVNMLVQTMQYLRTEQHIVFITTENSNA